VPQQCLDAALCIHPVFLNNEPWMATQLRTQHREYQCDNHESSQAVDVPQRKGLFASFAKCQVAATKVFFRLLALTTRDMMS
jgi:hypothetical protein